MVGENVGRIFFGGGAGQWETAGDGMMEVDDSPVLPCLCAVKSLENGQTGMG